MEEYQKNKKRIIIILVYFLLFFLFCWFLYSVIRPDTTCFDGKKNQNEEEADCGGKCKPCIKEISAQEIEIQEKAFVYGGLGKFDVLLKFFNPNNRFGSSSFEYEITLKGTSGEILGKRSGKSFILPRDSKYAIENGFEIQSEPSIAEVLIKNTQWAEFENYEKPQLNIYEKRYDIVSGGVGFGQAYGLLRNESAFDFESVNVDVILRDSSGIPIALNSTEMRDIGSGDQRDFKLLWPSSFPGDVMQVEMEAETNVFDSQNFTKKYLPGGEFQKY